MSPVMVFLCFPSPGPNFLFPVVVSHSLSNGMAFSFLAWAGVNAEGNRWR